MVARTLVEFYSTELGTMASSCRVCMEELPDEGDYLRCSYCKEGLHWSCGGLKESSWRSMSNPTKSVWKCPDCRTPRRNLGNTGRSGSSSSLSAPDTGDKGDENLTIANIRKMLDRKFSELEESMDSRFKEIERSLEFNGGMIEDLQKSFKDTQQKIIVMEKKQEKLENQNQELRTRVRNLEYFVQEVVQEGNKRKIEISGIPQNADYKSFTAQIFNKIKVTDIVKDNEYTIEKTTIKKKDSEPQVKTLLVTLKDEETRDKIIEIIRKSKPTLKSEEFSPAQPSKIIYINEYLSPYMKKLLYEAKTIKKDKAYSYIWVRNGKIYVKKTEGADPIRLRCLEDLAKL